MPHRKYFRRDRLLRRLRPNSQVRLRRGECLDDGGIGLCARIRRDLAHAAPSLLFKLSAQRAILDVRRQSRDFGFEPREQQIGETAEVPVERAPRAPAAADEDADLLQPRPPVVTILGHVDHATTSLLDVIREAHYWAEHLEDFRMGVDGWWPDEGDWLPPIDRLVRNRMYWEGPIKDRPNVRPYALHRNGYAGMQRYGWLWSGDVESTWRTLEMHVPVGINTGLSGMPFWGTDTGGFVTTPELTGELYVRWFQFSSFCPLFPSHGRTSKLRLSWGWDTGDYGPKEISSYRPPAGLPDPSDLDGARRLAEPDGKIRPGIFHRNERLPVYEYVRAVPVRSAAEQLAALHEDLDRYPV